MTCRLLFSSLLRAIVPTPGLVIEDFNYFMALHSRMPEFLRETGAWLLKQYFWAKMSSEEKVSWLESRERIAMQYEDVFFIRELE